MLVVAVADTSGCLGGEASPKATTAANPPAPGKPDDPAPRGLFQHRGAAEIGTATGPIRFVVELALTDAERARGLMERTTLADDAGMLFIFPSERVQSFWMKNTLIPLDMIFIDSGGTIVGIVESADPLTLTSRSVGRASRYVLEVNGGLCRRLGISAGMPVRFEGVSTDLVDPRVLARAPPAASGGLP